MAERSDGGCAGRGNGRLVGTSQGGVDSRQQAGGNGFDVTLDAADLASKVDLRIVAKLERGR